MSAPTEDAAQPTPSAPELVLATTNPDKIAEFRALLADAPFTLVDPRDLGLDLDVPETGATFADNAAIKARAWSRAAGRLALADDSGLEIDALGGQPGIHSARWAAPEMTYPVRNQLLLERLAGVPTARRTARYRCAIAVADGERVLIAVEGVVEGRIAEAARGHGGFGYDPIFEIPEVGLTFGEMSAAGKHHISHRGRAAAAALREMRRLRAAGPPI